MRDNSTLLFLSFVLRPSHLSALRSIFAIFAIFFIAFLLIVFYFFAARIAILFFWFWIFLFLFSQYALYVSVLIIFNSIIFFDRIFLLVISVFLYKFSSCYLIRESVICYSIKIDNFALYVNKEDISIPNFSIYWLIFSNLLIRNSVMIVPCRIII
jgi:hypothetical protein